MLPFSERMLLRLLDDEFLPPLLDEIGLQTLFGLVYELPTAALVELEMGNVDRRQLAVPVLETLHTRGSESATGSEPRRVLVERSSPRQGRLEWLDALFELRLDTLVHDQGAPLESLGTRDLFSQLGEPASFPELVAALEASLGEGSTAALLERFQIVDLETFHARMPQIIAVAGAQAPPFDPEAPGAARRYSLKLGMCFADQLAPLDHLRRAQFCRELLEREASARRGDVFDDVEIRQPYAVLTLFPEDAAENNQLPGQNAAGVRDLVRQLFATEEMIAHFVSDV